MLTWSTAGESHGQALIGLIEGLPSGIPVTTEKLRQALARRRLGYGRGSRQKWEQDEVEILSGVRHGYTTGAPLTIMVGNSEWPKWTAVMSPDPVDPADLMVDAGKGDPREQARNRPLHQPRPGHADLAGMIAYDFTDARNILERASARETAARVALGEVAKSYLREVLGVEIVSHVTQIGVEKIISPKLPTPADLAAVDESPVRTLDPEAQTRFIAEIDRAKASADTVGGVAEVVAWNVPIGLGSHVSNRTRLDAALAAALMSIQSVKGVEIGDGVLEAERFGSSAHDEILLTEGELTRASNRAGGLEGGISNGQPIVARAAFKPISTVPKALRTVDLETMEPSTAFHQRSDTCQVPPGAVVCEAMMALTLAETATQMFAGRSLKQVRAAADWYVDYVRERVQANSTSNTASQPGNLAEMARE